MNEESTMSPDGQVTIPRAILDLLRLKAGDRVEFVVVRAGAAMLVPRNRPISSLFGRLARYGRPGTTLADYDAAVGEGVARHLDPNANRDSKTAA